MGTSIYGNSHLIPLDWHPGSGWRPLGRYKCIWRRKTSEWYRRETRAPGLEIQDAGWQNTAGEWKIYMKILVIFIDIWYAHIAWMNACVFWSCEYMCTSIVTLIFARFSSWPESWLKELWRLFSNKPIKALQEYLRINTCKNNQLSEWLAAHKNLQWHEGIGSLDPEALSPRAMPYGVPRQVGIVMCHEVSHIGAVVKRWYTLKIRYN